MTVDEGERAAAGARPRGRSGPRSEPTALPWAAPNGASDAVLLDRVATDLAVRRRLLLDAARRVRRAADPEAVHDLRVACRRLAAAYRVWRDLLRPRARKQVTRALRVMRQRAGEARDLEILVELLERRARVAPGPIGAALAREARRAESRLARPRHAVASWVRANRMRMLSRWCRRAERQIAETLNGRVPLPEVPRHPGLATAVLDLAVQRGHAAAGAWRAAIASTEDAALHDARICIKKWRYALECLDDAGIAQVGARIGRLRDLQRMLGELQDLAVLRGYLEQRARRGASPETLRAALAGIEEERRTRLEALRVRDFGGELSEPAEAGDPQSAGPRPLPVRR